MHPGSNGSKFGSIVSLCRDAKYCPGAGAVHLQLGVDNPLSWPHSGGLQLEFISAIDDFYGAGSQAPGCQGSWPREQGLTEAGIKLNASAYPSLKRAASAT